VVIYTYVPAMKGHIHLHLPSWKTPGA